MVCPLLYTLCETTPPIHSSHYPFIHAPVLIPSFQHPSIAAKFSAAKFSLTTNAIPSMLL